MSIFTNPATSSKEETVAYTAALLGLLDKRDPLEVLEQTPSSIRDTLANIQPARLAQPEAPRKWSVLQVLAHLADSEIVWGWRLRMILAHDRPSIQGYDQDAWAQHLHYTDADPNVALDVFDVLRRWNVRLLKHASAEDLQRVGVHAERGEESVAHLMKLYAAHDLLHRNQIARILLSV